MIETRFDVPFIADLALREKQMVAIADHVYSLKLGKVAFAGNPTDLTAHPALLKKLFL